MTVRNTILPVLDKLELDSKQELVVWAVRHWLMEDLETGIDSKPKSNGQ